MIEMVCHPGHVCAELRTGTVYVWQRQRELEIHTGSDLPRRLAELEIELVEAE
jgi:predicted glycoside hydrolase/deacetylase ChbG (UPF0249 family)